MRRRGGSRRTAGELLIVADQIDTMQRTSPTDPAISGARCITIYENKGGIESNDAV